MPSKRSRKNQDITTIDSSTPSELKEPPTKKKREQKEITSSKENSRSSTSKQSDGKTSSRKSKRTMAQRQQSTHVEVDITSEHTKKPRTKKNVVSTNKDSDDVVSKVTTTQRVRKGQKVLEGVTVPVHVESSTRGRDDEKRTSKKKAVYKPSTKIKKGPTIESSCVVPMDQKVHHHSHGLTPGTVMVLGMGDLGQLGVGESILERKKPYPVGGILEEKNIIQVVCGGVHTVALTKEGQIYSWGCNDEGALGRSIEKIDEYSPGMVENMSKVKVVQISAGDSHTAALADNGSVYCWGIFRDSDGPFGLISSSPSLKPELVYSSSFNKAIKVTSGANHVMILTEQGDIYTFGCGENGQLGRVPECFSTRGGRRGVGLLLAPQIVRFPKASRKNSPRFLDIHAGEHNSFAVASEDEGIYVWGLNHRGQLGTGDVTTKYVPEKVPEDWLWGWTQGNKDHNSLDIAGGSAHSLVCNKGKVYAMGTNEYGQLGLKDKKESMQPTEVRELSDARTVICGGRCSLAVTSLGEVYSWGIGSNYQLGCGLDEEDVYTPTKMQGKNLEGRKVISASSGGQHTALLVSQKAESTD